MHSQGKSVVTTTSSTKYDNSESIVIDPKILMEQFNWLLKDIQSRIKLLDGEISVKDNVNVISLKHSVKCLQRAEEKLCDLIGNKLSYLNEVDCKQVEREFNQLKEQIY